MSYTHTTKSTRTKIAKDYIANKGKGTTMRSLETKYGVSRTTINNAVQDYRKANPKAGKITDTDKFPVKKRMKLHSDLKSAMELLSNTYGLHITIKNKKSGKVKVTLQDMATHNS